MRCCSYIDVDPAGKFLICAFDAVVNIALLIVSIIFVGDVLHDICILHLCISSLSLLVVAALIASLLLRLRPLALPWLAWTALRVALYFLGPCVLGIASHGVPRVRGDAGIFFLFILPFFLGGLYSHFLWVIFCVYRGLPDPSKEAARKKASRDAKRRKLSETTRRGIVALCIAPGLPVGIANEAPGRANAGSFNRGASLDDERVYNTVC